MFIIGCDFHSRFQQIAMLDPATGEVIKRRLEHENGQAKTFYATLPSPARVGMEATCDAQWFERVLREHHHELWIGDAAAIRAAMVCFEVHAFTNFAAVFGMILGCSFAFYFTDQE
jgi:hypothetical protein